MSLMCTANAERQWSESLTQQTKKLQKRNHGACECGEDRNRLDEPTSLECRNAPLCSLLEGCRPRQRSPEGPIAQKRRNRVEENARSGSSARKTWFRLSRGTNLAPGISAAISWPSANGTRTSPLQWVTNVGAFTFGRKLVTLISESSITNLSIISGVAETRSRSLNQRDCSAVPSGMNCEVNHCR